MVSFPAIDAPTAALIGGVSGFVADNATSIIQRNLKRRNQVKREKIDWYKDTIQYSKEIKVFLITNKQLHRVWSNVSEGTLPSEEEIHETIDNLSAEELIEGNFSIGMAEIGDILEVENPGSEPIPESDLPREEIKETIIERVDTKKFERRQEVEAQVEEDMEKYQIRLTEHLASAPMELDDSVRGPLVSLLAHCFGLTIKGDLNEETYEEIHAEADTLIESCGKKIKELEGSNSLI